jgi:ParB family chromosome partitioning protein
MKKPDFTSQLRAAAEQPAPASKSDLWTSAAPGAVVQRDITRPLAGAAREINLDAIRPDDAQPRKTMSEESLEELAQSVRDVGVIQPVTVAWSESLAAYVLITGHRRYQAALRAGLTTIPAIIRPATPDAERRLVEQLAENLHRENIPPIEEAQAIKAMMDVGDLTQRQAARKLNKPLTYVNEALSLLKLAPEVLRVAQGRQLPKHALIEIARAKTPEEQAEALDAALSAKHSYRAVVERRATKSASGPTHASRRFKRRYDLHELQASITVAFDRVPEKVDRDAVIDALRRLADTLEREGDASSS